MAPSGHRCGVFSCCWLVDVLFKLINLLLQPIDFGVDTPGQKQDFSLASDHAQSFGLDLDEDSKLLFQQLNPGLLCLTDLQ